MVKFIARVRSMSQKFSTDKEDNAKVTLNLSLEIKDGFDDVPNLAEILNSPLEFDVAPIQPGLITPPKSK
jgi:hypothetical protein